MAMDIVSTFSERLKIAIDDSGITAADLSRKLGMSKQSISAYLTGVRKPKRLVIGAIAKELHVSPTWLIGYDVEKDLPSNLIPFRKIKRAPLIGQIACGQPILAAENIENYIPYPDFIEADFCLTCKGDSMIGAGIYDGDIVFIKQQSDVEDGEVAAVRVGHDDGCEATLKRVFHGHHKLTLVPENPAYSNIVFEKEQLNEVDIIGRAVWYLSKVK